MLLRLSILSIGTCWVAWLCACGPGGGTGGSGGSGSASGSGSTGGSGTCTPSLEVCDGEDNDCDGLIDENGLESLPGVDPVVPGPVEFVEAVGDYFFVGGVAPSLVDTQKERIWVALYDATGARLNELDLADPVNVGDKVRAAVAPSGDRAVVTHVVPQTAPVYAALLQFDLDTQSPTFGTITPLVGLDEPAVTSVQVPTPDLAIPVFDDSVPNDQLVLFVMDNMGGSQGDVVALRYEVNTLCGNNDELCPPTGPTNVAQNVLRDDFVVMAPTDPTMDFVLGYFQSTTLHLTHVPRASLVADPGGQMITSFPLKPELAAGPGGAALLAYRSLDKLTVSRFEADTFECTGNPSVFVESCPQELGDTGGERPSAAYWPAEEAWLVGDKDAVDGWGVRQLRASDGEVLAELMETNPDALAMHLAINDSDLVLTSKSNDGTQNPSLVRPLEQDEPCQPPVFQAGGASADWAWSVGTDPDGNTVVAGRFDGTASFGKKSRIKTLTSRGSGDIFVAKYNANSRLMWVEQAGGSDFDSAASVAIDSNGDIIVAGSFAGAATFGKDSFAMIATSSGGSDAFVAKYSANGDLAWLTQAGGSESDSASGVAIDAADEAFVTGSFSGNADFGGGGGPPSLTSSGEQDIFVAKYAPDGSLSWVNAAGGTESEGGRAITTDPSGSVLLTGSFRGQATFGGVATITSVDDPPQLVNEPDIFVAKYDSGGNFDWVTRAGRAAEDYGNGIASDASGNVFVVGSVFHIRFCESCGSSIPLDDPHEDIFIAKYDPLGNLQWSKEFGGDGYYQRGRDVVADAAGNILIAGAFWDQAIFGEAPNEVTLISQGGGDVFLAKYDTTGALTWVQQAGAAGSEQGIAMTLNDDQRVVVVGRFQQDATFGEDPDTITITSEGSDDVFAAKYNPDGTLSTYW